MHFTHEDGLDADKPDLDNKISSFIRKGLSAKSFTEINELLQGLQHHYDKLLLKEKDFLSFIASVLEKLKRMGILEQASYDDLLKMNSEQLHSLPDALAEITINNIEDKIEQQARYKVDFQLLVKNLKYAKDLGQGLRFLNGLEMKDQKKFRDVLISNLNNKSFMKAVCYGVLQNKLTSLTYASLLILAEAGILKDEVIYVRLFSHPEAEKVSQVIIFIEKFFRLNHQVYDELFKSNELISCMLILKQEEIVMTRDEYKIFESHPRKKELYNCIFTLADSKVLNDTYQHLISLRAQNRQLSAYSFCLSILNKAEILKSKYRTLLKIKDYCELKPYLEGFWEAKILTHPFYDALLECMSQKNKKRMGNALNAGIDAFNKKVLVKILLKKYFNNPFQYDSVLQLLILLAKEEKVIDLEINKKLLTNKADKHIKKIDNSGIIKGLSLLSRNNASGLCTKLLLVNSRFQYRIEEFSKALILWGKEKKITKKYSKIEKKIFKSADTDLLIGLINLNKEIKEKPTIKKIDKELLKQPDYVSIMVSIMGEFKKSPILFTPVRMLAVIKCLKLLSQAKILKNSKGFFIDHCAWIDTFDLVFPLLGQNGLLTKNNIKNLVRSLKKDGTEKILVLRRAEKFDSKNCYETFSNIFEPAIEPAIYLSPFCGELSDEEELAHESVELKTTIHKRKTREGEIIDHPHKKTRETSTDITALSPIRKIPKDRQHNNVDKNFEDTLKEQTGDQKALTVFKEKLKALLVNEAYKFSIQRTQKDTLIIYLNSKESFYGDPEQIEENLIDLIQSLISAIAGVNIKNDQYKMKQDLETGELTIIAECKILNTIAGLLEKAGRPESNLSYLVPLSQAKAALFGSSKSKSSSPTDTALKPAVEVGCLMQ